MIPLQLTLRNFMCYRADGEDAPLRLDLDGLHVVCLSGENGAGKSALLDAITWALWGEARTPDDDLIAQGAGEMLVELVFVLGAQHYRVSRRRQRGRTGPRGGQMSGKSMLDLLVQDGEGWRSISEAGVRETQAQINGLLRMSYQTFINASYLRQGRADEFTGKTPAERKQVLADILDLNEYAGLELRARERVRELDAKINGLHGRIEQLSDQAGRIDFWQAEVTQVEQRISGLDRQVAEAEQTLQTAGDRLQQLETQAGRRKELAHRLQQVRAELDDLDRQIGDIRARMAGDEQVLVERDAIAAGMQLLQAARNELQRLDDLSDQFDRLEHRRRDLQADLKQALNDLRQKLAAAEQQYDLLCQRSVQLESLRAAVATIEQELAASARLVPERERLLAQRADLEQRAARGRELRGRQQELEQRIALRRTTLQSALEEQQRLVQHLTTQLATAAGWERDLALAREQADLLTTDEQHLAGLSEQEQQCTDLLNEHQVEQKRIKAQVAELERNQHLLGSAGHVCPVCRSDLGAEGVQLVHVHYAEEIETLQQHAAEEAQALKAQHSQLTQVRAARSALEQQMTERRVQAAKIGWYEQQLAASAAWRSDHAHTTAAVAELQAQLAAGDYDPAAQAELETVLRSVQELQSVDALEHERTLIDQQLAQNERGLQQRSRQEGTLEAHRRELAEIEAGLASLGVVEAQVKELQRRIDTNDFADEIRQEGRRIVAAIEALGYTREAHAAARAQVRELARWEVQERALQLADQRATADRALLQQTARLADSRRSEAETMAGEDALLEQQLRALPAARAEADAARTGLRKLQHEAQAAQKDLGEKQGYLQQSRDAAAKLKLDQAEEQRLTERRGLFADLVEAFGKKGVQAMLIEWAIPQIEDEANQLLGRMTDNQMHVSFDMQRDTKKGDTIETLEIKIADALGTRTYDAFSGGEALRANFAVRIALSRLLARRAGAQLETLVIDEGFGALDAQGRERMVEAITSVQDDFKRIIVVTHIDELKDRFPAQIEITKTPHGSGWELH
jgi:exonuclease SbcC